MIECNDIRGTPCQFNINLWGEYYHRLGRIHDSVFVV